MNKRTASQPVVAAALILSNFSVHAADYLSMTGAQLYGGLCASCHGVSARGDGPVARSLKVQVPDLTMIAVRQGNKFPVERVTQIIDGRFVVGAHGTREMPVWGEVLSRSEIGNPDAERATQTMISRLVEYLRSIQRT